MNEVTTAPEVNNNDALVGLTASVVAAYVGGGQNQVRSEDLPGLISSVHSSLAMLNGSAAQAEEKKEPAVAIRSSVKPDYIICLEDGKRLKMLKRYIASRYNLTPDQYRAKWGLPSDYPMVAPNYAETRRQLAHSIGLGKKRSRPASADTAAAPKATGTATRGRRAKAAAGDAPKATRTRKATGAAATPKAAGRRGGRAKANANA